MLSLTGLRRRDDGARGGDSPDTVVALEIPIGEVRSSIETMDGSGPGQVRTEPVLAILLLRVDLLVTRSRLFLGGCLSDECVGECGALAATVVSDSQAEHVAGAVVVDRE